ncbi:uromodulin [Magallana gigas]|uniref:uromodulin n=1 Tax=Magallana gigas TaxID=29159 RepID=UPI00333E99A4
MWRTHLFATLNFLLILRKGAAFNPCDDGNHFLLPNAGWRGTACKRTRDTSICDRYVETGANKWYKVLGHDDKSPRKMAEEIAEMFHCGTDYPLYLPNGSHPTSDGIIVTRNACLHVGADKCKELYAVQILKCGTFFLYNLSRPNSCDIAYCFGENETCSKPDPCEEKNRLTLLVSGDRSTSCKDQSLKLCDSVLRSSWYRPMKNSIDVKMASSCVERHSCGTEEPIWLKGAEPTLADKTVDMKACVTVGKSGACSCDMEIDIQVRNCSSYLVYNLSSTPSCPQRYCFGHTGQCHENVYDSNSMWKEPSKIVLISLAMVIVLALLVILGFMIHKNIFRPVLKVNVQPSIKEKDNSDANLDDIIKPK